MWNFRGRASTLAVAKPVEYLSKFACANMARAHREREGGKEGRREGEAQMHT